MQKLAEVEQAKALMTEAVAWSVMRWLTEKKRVRKTADKANDALWALQKEVKTFWSPELRAAYDDLAATDNPGNSKPTPKAGGNTDPKIKLLAKHVKELDDEAWRAHMDAEETFDRAEKYLSTAMAREGCKKAINSWDLYEKAIQKAETGIQSANATK